MLYNSGIYCQSLQDIENVRPNVKITTVMKECLWRGLIFISLLHFFWSLIPCMSEAVSLPCQVVWNRCLRISLSYTRLQNPHPQPVFAGVLATRIFRYRPHHLYVVWRSLQGSLQKVSSRIGAVDGSAGKCLPFKHENVNSIPRTYM